MKSITKILPFLLLVFAVSISTAQDYHVRFALLGNSITEGSGLSNPAEDSYPAQLADMLAEVYGDTVTVLNAGVSGRTLLKNGDYPLWDEDLFQQAYEFAPDICYILLGTNDTKPYNWDVYGDEFYSDYLAMIDTFKLRNPRTKFIFCYPPPAWEIVFDIRDSVIVNEVIPIVDSVLKVRDGELIDFYEPLYDSVDLFPDKIHPNVAGATVMAQMIRDKVIETNIIHEVETGYTFVTSLKSDVEIARANDTISVSWISINADSAFLNGQKVDINGSASVSSGEDATYTLVAYGKKSKDSLVLNQTYYQPEISKVFIFPGRHSMNQGDSVLLTTKFVDQFSKQYTIEDETITWTIDEGDGELIEKTGESAIYIAGTSETVVVTVAYNDVSASNKITVSAGSKVSKQSVDNVLIYPNPFDKYITVEMSESISSEIKASIFTLSGQLILEKIVDNKNEKNIRIDTPNLAKGTYLVVLEWNNKKYKNLINK